MRIDWRFTRGDHRIPLFLSKIGRTLFSIPMILLLLGIIFFPINGTKTSPDSSLYLSYALNIYKGHGYLEADWTHVLHRGPVFPVLIASFFWLFGVSVKHAFWLVRLFYLGNILLVYFLGRKLYGKWPGLGASLLTIASFVVNKVSTRLHIDNSVAFFILLSLFLIRIALERRRYLWFVLTGIALAASYLLKELSVIICPFPLLAVVFIRKYRSKNNLRGVVVTIAILVMLISIWAIYIHCVSGENFLPLGYVGKGAIEALTPQKRIENSLGVCSIMNTYWDYLKHYLLNYVIKTCVLGPLFIVGWCLVLIRACVKKSASDLFMILIFTLFIPLMLLQGKVGYRVGNSLAIYLLSYIVIAEVLFVLSKWICRILELLLRNRGAIALAPRYCFLCIIILMLYVQISAGGRMRGILMGRGLGGMNYYASEDLIVVGWHGVVAKRAGDWISKNIPKDKKIMCDWHWSDAIHFYANGDYQIYDIPYLVLPKYSAVGRLKGVSWTKYEKCLYIWPHKGRVNSENYLRILCEDVLLSDIKKRDIEYIIVTERRNFLSLYFDEHPGYRRVAHFGGGQIKIYQICEPTPFPAFKLRIGNTTSRYFKLLRKRNPDLYRNPQ